MDRRQQNFWPLAALILIVLIIAISYFWISRNEGIVSPVPPKPSFQIIYYTPTPGMTTPTSTPSATPKVKAIIAPLKAPAKPTATPSAKLTITASPTP